MMTATNHRVNRHADGTPVNNDSTTLNGLQRNFETQYYKGIPLQQIDRGYGAARARRFTINGTNQNCWIPMKHLNEDGTIKPGQDIDYVIIGSKPQFKRAGVNIKFEIKQMGGQIND